MKIDNPQILLIIPCFNEQETIGPLLDEIISCGIECQVIVIDDGSSDATYDIASKRALTIKLLKNLGIGGAVQTGIKYAAENDFDFCIQIDGDGQHPPSEISKLLKSHQNDPYAMIIGSHYLCNESFRSTFSRRFGGKVISQIIHVLFRRARITDPTSGMRLMDRRAIRFFAKHYPLDYPEPISLAWALKSGLDVGECAVKMRSRNKGESSIHGWKPLVYMFRVLGYITLARIADLI
ncbi:MAG: glycosyltransferase family 2 protein [Legionellales bacterium]|nr:glycosyltransferase family 2 protein [Legionellales bacterium]